MSNCPPDYAALARADRAAAAAAILENVRRQHIQSAERWEILVAEDLQFRQMKSIRTDPDQSDGEAKWILKKPV